MPALPPSCAALPHPSTLTTFTPLPPWQFSNLKAYYEKLAAHPKIVEAKERMATSPATTC
jgi:hypothetical protein